ncbi:MAG: hypothetical protein IIW56_02195 [Oscillospiraceae bacterium]|nr:hypothetical protein [Oscillospiraceae bacterium]
MKRIFCLVLAILLVTVSVTPVLAAEGESVVMPRYSYIVEMCSGLQIGTLGLSACQANCYIQNADHIVLTAKLQQYNGSTWTTVKTWTATGTNYASISKNYAVYSGYTYCLRATCAVFDADGKVIENGTCYSNQVTY